MFGAHAEETTVLDLACWMLSGALALFLLSPRASSLEAAAYMWETPASRVCGACRAGGCERAAFSLAREREV